MRIGIGIGITAGTGLAASLFDRVHQELFGNGEQGIYMPSVHESFLRGDLYQDHRGIAQVTAVGQPVGLWLDRSQGLVLGPECAGVTSVNGAPTGGDPITTYDIASAEPIVAGKHYEVLVTVENYDYVGEVASDVGFNAATFGTDVRFVSDGEYRRVAVARTDGVLELFTRSTATANFRNISVRELPGNHASQPTAAYRPTLQQDANGIYVLRCDGEDDWMVTPQIDLTSTNKVSVLAGARKVGTSNAVIVESSTTAASSQGAFAIFGSASALAGEYLARSSGTTSVLAAIPAPGQSSDVLTLMGDIAAPSLTLRVSGAEDVVTTTQGTGNYGNYPIYIGARNAGADLQFNGDIYGVIVCGAARTAEQVALAESLVNRYVRATVAPQNSMFWGGLSFLWGANVLVWA